MSDFDRVTVDGVSRHYGRRRALTDISFTAGPGDIVGLLGPNGAGKSTLLAILGTLLAASTGQVRYGGSTSIEAGAALRARIGMLGHDLFLYPELSARENLVFFGQLYDLPDAPRAAAAALERAGLAGRADDLVSSFSRGMRQRVALERALLHRPRLLLLDEPFTGLDLASAASLVARLKDERARGVVTVLATHDLDVVDGLLNEVVFLQGGKRIAMPPTPGALRDRYRQAMHAS
ncbi:MAG: ABC transporter ATP-binding protein [Acidobacteria bacterium]|nr:ABC transporter ATP-binding protein [Acidobacteriota bacterium]